MPRRFFHGWVVVACVFVVLCVGFGCAYSFGVFFHSLQTEFGASRGSVSLVFSFCGFLYFGLGAFSGSAADRLGARWIVLAGTLCVGFGLILASRAQSLWQVYATYGAGVGLGVGMAYVPAVGAVQRWFVLRRGLASGLAVSGIGVGTLLFPLLSGTLIRLAGWRAACAVLGGSAVFLGSLAAWFIEDSPRGRGLLPDGGVPEDRPVLAPGNNQPTPSHRSSGDSTLPGALRSPTFWLLYAGSLFTSLGLFIPFVHIAAYARDQGLSEQAGVLLISLIGVGSVLGRFALGGTADRLGRRASLGVMYAGMAMMMLWWLGSTSTRSLAVFAVLFGGFYGGFVAIIPALTADYFSGGSLGGIIGALYTSAAFGSLLGPTLAGVAFDLSHSYAIPIVGSAVANALAALSAAALAPPPALSGSLEGRGFTQPRP